MRADPFTADGVEDRLGKLPPGANASDGPITQGVASNSIVIDV